MNKEKIDYSLYLVTDRDILGNRDLVAELEKAIKGGVSIIQLREKNLSTKEFYYLATKVRILTYAYSIPFIINDRIDIALAVDADGVHIGLDDMPVKVARKLLGQDKLIGSSVNCVEEAIRFEKEGSDYLGVGAMYPTSTKLDAEAVTIDTLRAIKAAVSIPIVGIGGINETNASNIIKTGVDGIAVVSAILGKKDVFVATKGLIAIK